MGVVGFVPVAAAQGITFGDLAEVALNARHEIHCQGRACGVFMSRSIERILEKAREELGDDEAHLERLCIMAWLKDVYNPTEKEWKQVSEAAEAKVRAL